MDNETQPLIEAEEKNRQSRSGIITWFSKESHAVLLGVTKWWTLILLCLGGFCGSLTWAILSIIASLPSDFPDATMTDVQLIVLGIIHGLVYLGVLTCVSWFTGISLSLRIGKSKPKSSTKKAWEMMSLFNRRNLKIWLTVQFFALLGILIAQSVLAMDGSAITHKSADSMFTNGTITQITAAPDSTDSNLRKIALHCNGNSTYIMDSIEAQSFVNVHHITAGLSLLLAIGYLSHLLNLWWMELSTYKKDLTSRSVSGLSITIGKIGQREDADISPSITASAVYIHEKENDSVTKDSSMYAYKLTLVIGSLLLIGCWVMELLSLAGLYNGLNSPVDHYGGLYMLELIVNWCIVLALVSIVFAILMKDTLLKYMSASQRFTKLWSAVAMALISLLFLTNGAFWLTSHQVPVKFEVPHVVMCRIHPDLRTYYANRVMEAVLSTLFLFCISDAYYTHCSKTGKSELLVSKNKSAGKVHNG